MIVVAHLLDTDGSGSLSILFQTLQRSFHSNHKGSQHGTFTAQIYHNQITIRAGWTSVYTYMLILDTVSILRIYTYDVPVVVICMLTSSSANNKECDEASFRSGRERVGMDLSGARFVARVLAWFGRCIVISLQLQCSLDELQALSPKIRPG